MSLVVTSSLVVVLRIVTVLVHGHYAVQIAPEVIPFICLLAELANNVKANTARLILVTMETETVTLVVMSLWLPVTARWATVSSV